MPQIRVQYRHHLALFIAMLVLILFSLFSSRSLGRIPTVVEQKDYRIEVEHDDLSVYLKDPSIPMPESFDVNVRQGARLVDRVHVHFLDWSEEGLPRFGNRFYYREQSVAGLQFDVDIK